ncbi:MAG: glycosyltransferase family 4 protein [Cyanobacteria bacterium P01_D01_bin.6]
MKWALAFPWITSSNINQEYWLSKYIPESTEHQFQFIPRPKELIKFSDRRSKYTSVTEWFDYLQHGQQVWRSEYDGIITGFPQMPAVFGTHGQLHFGKKKPIVAWCFAIGNLSGGLRQSLSKWSLNDIDRFVVITESERRIYSDWLGLPIDRFQFVPHCEKPIPIEWEQEVTDPFITSQGAAHRDFDTFFKAIEHSNIKTVIASSKVALEGKTIPASVTTPFGISRKDCWKISQQSRFSVVPMIDRPDIPAAGIVTIVEAMLMGRPVVATRCNGAEDYIVHGETGFLVEPNSVDSLKEAIETLWHDDQLREQMSLAAKQYADKHFSYQGGANALLPMLDELSSS